MDIFHPSVAITVFSAWLTVRLSGKKDAQKTTINERDITQDIAQISVIIQAELQRQKEQAQQEKGEKQV